MHKTCNDDCADQEVRVCELPPAPDGKQTITMPPPCPAPEPACVVLPVPDCPPLPPEKRMPVPVLHRPCLPCNWEAVRFSSTPPEIGCPVIDVGFGKVDGGIKAKFKHPSVKCPPEYLEHFQQDAWHSVLDLSSAPGFDVWLTVLRNGMTQRISAMEFRTLAVKLVSLAFNSGVSFDLGDFGKVLDGTMRLKQAELKPIKLKNADGSYSYALAQVLDNNIVGMPIPLNEQIDASGNLVGYTISCAIDDYAIEVSPA